MEIKKQNLHILETSTSRYSDIQVLSVDIFRNLNFIIVSFGRGKLEERRGFWWGERFGEMIGELNVRIGG